MKISVNILCWNTLKTLKMTLEMLKSELTYCEHEIVIVDNGSNDETREYIHSVDRHNIIYLFNSENVGISRGKNQGIRHSKGDYILLLDGDVVPVPNSIRKMIDFLDENQDKHAIGFYPNKFAIEYNKNGQHHHEDFCFELHEPVPSPTACLFYGLYRREVFEKVMMDETGEYAKPGYGWEDHDFFMQMQAAGITQWVAHMNHKGGKYYHAINSSIRPNCLGYDKYMQTSQSRSRQFKEKWEPCPAKS